MKNTVRILINVLKMYDRQKELFLSMLCICSFFIIVPSIVVAHGPQSFCLHDGVETHTEGEKADFYTFTGKNGIYTYYVDKSSDSQNNQPVKRIYTDGDRQAVELRNSDDEWQLMQVRNTATGVITNYHDMEVVDYTRELQDNVIAHYKTHHNILSDTKGEEADFYTLTGEGWIYTYFFDSFFAVKNNQTSKRIFYGRDTQEIEVKNTEGEWELVEIKNTSTNVAINHHER